MQSSRHALVAYVCGVVQVPTVSLSAFAFLFSELIQYTMDRATSTADLEERCVRLCVCGGARAWGLTWDGAGAVCVQGLGFGAGLGFVWASPPA